MSIGLHLLCILAIFVAIAGSVLLCFIVWFLVHGANLSFEIPWMKWLTIDDVAAQGYWLLMVLILICEMYDCGLIEVRERADAPSNSPFTTRAGFNIFTARLFEFRRVVKPPRRKKIEKKSISWEPNWCPT